jgi:hypothetical protein
MWKSTDTSMPIDWPALVDLIVRLTELRQSKCEHLCIENFAPELLGKCLREIVRAPYAMDE